MTAAQIATRLKILHDEYQAGNISLMAIPEKLFVLMLALAECVAALEARNPGSTSLTEGN